MNSMAYLRVGKGTSKTKFDCHVHFIQQELILYLKHFIISRLLSLRKFLLSIADVLNENISFKTVKTIDIPY